MKHLFTIATQIGAIDSFIHLCKYEFTNSASIYSIS